MQRTSALDRAQNAAQPFDIVVIGGGASGLGAALDAAARGHRVALFEQSDFAKGTSSRSTKLVHGGVRYLQQGNIPLVRKALHERGCLSRNAPHLVHSQAFVIPNYSWWEGPFYGIGMKVYDQLAGELGLAPSRHLSRDETLAAIPTIEREHLLGGVIYHDGQFDDARLAIHLAMTAEAHGATVLNYCRCTGLIKERGKVAGARILDLESGDAFEVRAKTVINATGVFVDELRTMDDAQAKAVIAVSQGVHLVLPREFLPGDAAIMVPKTADGRVLFAVPWHDHVIVGTTDTPLDHHELEPRALPEEIGFILKHAGKYLTKDPLPQDVLSVFAGLRPLVKSADSTSTMALSRDHSILVSASGLITLTGGKWTTYRKMAQDVIDRAEAIGGLQQPGCPTENLKIHGWTRDKPTQANLGVYGSDAEGILAIIRHSPQLAAKLHPALPYQAAEVVWHAREEMARSVEDVLARRTRALFLNARASIEAAPAVASILAREICREQAWIEGQLHDYRRLAAGYCWPAKKPDPP